MEPTKMYVWDGDERPEEPGTRTVIAIADDGSCIALKLRANTLYTVFATTKWDHCAPIPEKKLRPMTREEMIAWADSVESHGWVVKYNDGCWESTSFFAFIEELDSYSRTRVTRDADGYPVYGEPEPFMVEEEEG